MRPWHLLGKIQAMPLGMTFLKRKIQNDTDTVQAAYQLACEILCTQTEGLDMPSTTVFTRSSVEISMYQKNFHNETDEISLGARPGIQCSIRITSMKKGALWPI